MTVNSQLTYRLKPPPSSFPSLQTPTVLGLHTRLTRTKDRYKTHIMSPHDSLCLYISRTYSTQPANIILSYPQLSSVPQHLSEVKDSQLASDTPGVVDAPVYVRHRNKWTDTDKSFVIVTRSCQVVSLLRITLFRDLLLTGNLSFAKHVY